jgi:hypothetical protein
MKTALDCEARLPVRVKLAIADRFEKNSACDRSDSDRKASNGETVCN